MNKGQIQELEQKQASVSQTQITAPISGTVVTRSVYAGQYVKEGDRLFEIADFSTMWLQLNIYERDLPWVRTGQSVEVTAPAVARLPAST